MPKIELYNMDCMKYMEGLPDNAFDLAVVDPPYGQNRDGQRKEVYNGAKAKHNRKEFVRKSWDKPPSEEYFRELFRVSINQIIWGANYYPQYLKLSPGWFFWDKGQDLDQADGELAFTSFNKPLRRRVMNRVELLKEGTIHPTQKPIKLYSILLDIYAKSGDTILDTHLGSGSSAIAAHRLGHNFVGCELDADYFQAAQARIERETAQESLFEPQEIYK